MAATNMSIPTALRAQDDSPASEDRLGIARYVNGLSHFITSCDTPMTIALQGGWGTGKTTLFDLIEKELPKSRHVDEANSTRSSGEKGMPGELKHAESSIGIKERSYEPGCEVIRLNTWPLSTAGMADALTLALVSRILKTLEDALSKDDTQVQQHDDSTKKLGRARKALNLVSNGLGILVGAYIERRTSLGIAGDTSKTFVRNSLKAVGKEILEPEEDTRADKQNGPAEDSDALTDWAQLKQCYEWLLATKGRLDEAINACIEQGYFSRLIIFIDDLDRLDPAKAVAFLEGIKNFMDCEGCVFVLAIDEEVVFDGIAAKYPGKLGEERKRLFFDKIIQLPFEMPVERYDIEQYLESLPGCTSHAMARRFSRIVRELSNPNRAGGIQQNNPRAIKRYMNLYELYVGFFNATNKPCAGDGCKRKQQRDALEEVQKLYFLDDPEAQDCLFALIVFRENSQEAFDSLLREYSNPNREDATAGPKKYPAWPTSPKHNATGAESEDLSRLKRWRENRSEQFAQDSYQSKGNQGVTFEVVFNAVVQQVLLGDGTSLGKCLRTWQEYDGKDRKDPQAVNRLLCEGEVLEGGGGNSDRGWLVTAKGKELGLMQSYFFRSGEPRNLHVLVSLEAARYGSNFQTEVDELLRKAQEWDSDFRLPPR